MAFCRWGPESDVYMYVGETRDGEAYFCSNCLLEEGDEVSVKLNSAEAAARHLQLHRDAGHKVPPGTIAAVLADGRRNAPVP